MTTVDISLKNSIDAAPGIQVDKVPVAGVAPEFNQISLEDSLPPARFLFEGDILLTPNQAKTILETVISARAKLKLRKRVKRQLSSTQGARWPTTAPINYNFHTSLGAQDIVDITSALNFWQSDTCITFHSDSNPTGDSLQFFRGQGCYSMIGKIGGQQSISIGKGCNKMGVIAHEIGHALGLWHEQSRPDADQHIRVLSQNIIPAFLANFLHREWTEMQSFDIPYDLGSVMHYGAQAFVNDWTKNSIETLMSGYQSVIGQRDKPAFYDVKIINKAYCDNRCPVGSVQCKYGGYPNPLDCSRCLCPDGLGSANCGDPAQSIGANCGGLITVGSEWADFTSPGYPTTPYDTGVECNWLIRSSPGTHVLLEFQDRFQFFCTSTCLDFVEIKNATDFGSTGYRYCCYQTPNIQFVSAGNEMIVLMRSFASKDVGFKARVRQDTQQAAFQASPPPLIITAATLPPVLTTTTSTSTTTTTTSTPTTTATTQVAATITLPSTSTTKTPSTTTTTADVGVRKAALFTGTPEGFWSTWADWSECTKTCGACGLRTRVRQCLTPPCSGDSQQFQRCNFEPCNGPAGTGDICTKVNFYDYPCGDKHNLVCSDAQHVQTQCEAPQCCSPFRVVDGTCRLGFSPKFGPTTSDWGPWGDCSGPPCGGCAVRTRHRLCSDTNCRGADAETKLCNLSPCGNCDSTNLPSWDSKSTCPCCYPLKEKDGVCVHQ